VRFEGLVSFPLTVFSSMKNATERAIHHDEHFQLRHNDEDDEETNRHDNEDSSEEDSGDEEPIPLNALLQQPVGKSTIRSAAAFVGYTSATWHALLFADRDAVGENFSLAVLPYENLSPPYVGYVEGAGVRTIEIGDVRERVHDKDSTIWEADGDGISDMMEQLLEDYLRSGGYRSVYINTVRTIPRKNQVELAETVAAVYGSRTPMAIFTYFGSDNIYSNKIFITKGSPEEDGWYTTAEELESELYGIFDGVPAVQSFTVSETGDKDQWDGFIVELKGTKGNKSVRIAHCYDVIDRIFSQRERAPFSAGISGAMGSRGSVWKNSLHQNPLTDMLANITKSPKSEFTFRHFEEILQLVGRLCGRDNVDRTRTLWVSEEGWEVIEKALAFAEELTDICEGLECFNLESATVATLRVRPQGVVRRVLEDANAKYALTRQSFHKSSTEVLADAWTRAFTMVQRDPVGTVATPSQKEAVRNALQENEGRYMTATDIANYLLSAGRVRNLDESGGPTTYNAVNSAGLLTFTSPRRGAKEKNQLNGVITRCLNETIGRQNMKKEGATVQHGGWRYEYRKADNKKKVAAFRLL
jgi:hypothetical protein